MKTAPTSRILLLANEFSSALSLREVASRAGLAMELDQVASRDEFFAGFAKSPAAMALISLSGVTSLSLIEALQHIRSFNPPVPAIVFGDEGVESPPAMEAIAHGASAYVPNSEMQRLPLIIDRLLRDAEGRAARGRLEHEAERAAQVLRENQKLVTIGRLTASISHEINNPLESITNLLYLLNTEPEMPAGARSYLALAQRELERVVQISKQTLNFYRESAGVVRVKPADLLEEVLVLYGRKIEEKRLQVVRQYESEEPVAVFPGEMRQVFSNLITNAIEASDRGGLLRLRVRRARQWSDTGIMGLRISIGDTGSGIEPAVKDRLGQLFFTTKGERGTGLGLWVTHAIVARFGGIMQVSSSTRVDHHGTVFSIFLPTNMRPQFVSDGGSSGSMAPRGGSSFSPARSIGQHGADTCKVGLQMTSGRTDTLRMAAVDLDDMTGMVPPGLLASNY